MAETKNPLPVQLDPVGDICIPVSVPNDTEWLWTLVKAVSFPSLKRYWSLANIPDNETVRKNWESRVYNPLVEAVLAELHCDDDLSDDCIDYGANAPFLAYSPQNPYTEPDLVPAGYPNQPFFKFSSISPDFLPEWLEGFVDDWLTDMTGYEPDDVLTVINSFPLFANWQDLLTSGFPRITLEVTGTGVIQIRLLLVPFGGRAIITVDVLPNVGDILDGIFSGDIRSIELERDLSSIPMELDSDHIEEIEIIDDGNHTIYITFLPALDATLIPFRYGGGIRSVTLCGLNWTDEPPPAECDIPTIIADDTFFEEEYAPQIFGEYFTETQANEAAKALEYDTTPQSIAPDAPVGVPDDVEKNALCAAVHRFVTLYASTKLCLIQSQNFVQILWTKMANAANNFYDAAVSLMSPIYSPNIFSCFVNDAAAITALQDDAAIEELACHIYDYLKSLAMSQSNFDAAVLDAATVLTGDAQKIACLMQNDGNLSLYINFLEGYQITLQKPLVDLPDCPCETALYRHYVHNFSDGMGEWVAVYSGSNKVGFLDGGRLKGANLGTVRRIEINWNDFDVTWRLRNIKVFGERIGGTSSASDNVILKAREIVNSNTSSRDYLNTSGQPNGSFVSCGLVPLSPHYDSNFKQLMVFVQAADPSDTSEIYLDRIEMLFEADYAPYGALTSDSDLCT